MAAADLLRKTRQAADCLGLTFHVGSQAMAPAAYGHALRTMSQHIVAAGVVADVIDVGGGFPSPIRGWSRRRSPILYGGDPRGIRAASQSAGIASCGPSRAARWSPRRSRSSCVSRRARTIRSTSMMARSAYVVRRRAYEVRRSRHGGWSWTASQPDRGPRGSFRSTDRLATAPISCPGRSICRKRRPRATISRSAISALTGGRCPRAFNGFGHYDERHRCRRADADHVQRRRHAAGAASRMISGLRENSCRSLSPGAGPWRGFDTARRKGFFGLSREDAGDPAAAKAVIIPFGLEASVSYGAGTAQGRRRSSPAPSWNSSTRPCGASLIGNSASRRLRRSLSRRAIEPRAGAT